MKKLHLALVALVACALISCDDSSDDTTNYTTANLARYWRLVQTNSNSRTLIPTTNYEEDVIYYNLESNNSYTLRAYFPNEMYYFSKGTWGVSGKDLSFSDLYTKLQSTFEIKSLKNGTLYCYMNDEDETTAEFTEYANPPELQIAESMLYGCWHAEKLRIYDDYGNYTETTPEVTNAYIYFLADGTYREMYDNEISSGTWSINGTTLVQDGEESAEIFYLDDEDLQIFGLDDNAHNYAGFTYAASIPDALK